MIVRKITSEQMWQALTEVNKLYGGNITWNRFDSIYSQRNLNKILEIKFTLRCISSKGKGHRLSRYYETRKRLRGCEDNYKVVSHQKRLISCCWHVHGNFFEKLFEISPDIIIYSRGKKYDINNWQWEDWNAGSIMNPIFISTLCEC